MGVDDLKVEMRLQSTRIRKAMKRPHNAHVGCLLKLYTQQVLELHDFELQLLGLLRQGVQAPVSEGVRALLGQLEEQTETHIARFGHVLRRLGLIPGTSHHRDTSRLITELRHQLRPAGRHYDLRYEAALLSALHKMEAFKIACYASTHSYARLLSFHDDLAPLEATYSEEKQMEERIENMMGELKDHSRNLELHLVA
jgi:ferritin-like metal-binding protein YciE